MLRPYRCSPLRETFQGTQPSRGPAVALCYTEGAMQVIAGTAKGQRLHAPRGLETRPLSARVKASLFDILGDRAVEARVLDLFAGTGQLGIEALSRGAAHATFVELNHRAIEAIGRNLEQTGFTAQATAVRQDVFLFLRRQGGEFTLVFVAPPQYQGIAAKTVEALDGSPLLEDEGLVVVQQFAKEPLAQDLNRLMLVDQRDYGSTTLLFYRT